MLTSFAGSRLFGQRYGTGVPSVLALHGWRRDHRDFDGVLASGLDAVALDLPGFGSTPPPPTAWGSPEYADAVAAVLDEMQAHVVVVGHSFGGRVAVHLAADHPEQIAGLVLSGAPLHRPTRRPAEAAPQLQARPTPGGSRRRQPGQDRGHCASATGRRTTAAPPGSCATSSCAPWRRTTQASSPGYVALSSSCGETTTPPPPVGGRTARSRAARRDLVVCAGAGHLTPLTVPGELRAAVERLQDLRPRALVRRGARVVTALDAVALGACALAIVSG